MANIGTGNFRLGAPSARLWQGLAAVLALLALWLGWSAYSQWRDAGTLRALESLRDQVVASAGQALAAQRKQLEQRLASPAVRTALATGNALDASRALAQGWNGAKQVEIVPVDLEAAYAGLPKSGYARLALLEGAMQANAAVAGSVRDGAGNALGVAAPAYGADKQLHGIAFAMLPQSPLTAALQGAEPPPGAYLALRHGNAVLLGKGDTALAEHSESLARTVPGTPLRVVAAVPDAASSPLGLGWQGCVVAALLCAGLAVLAWVGSRFGFARLRLRGKGGEQPATEAELTLQQAAQRAPIPPPPPPVPVHENTPAPPSNSNDLDPGIFRAYDIRGVVGQNLDVRVAEQIGQAIGTVMQEQGLNDIVVGRDGRLSGPDLAAGLIEGLRIAGRNVIDIGMVPTPVSYYGAYQLRTGCCVSVTGSHNPPDYTGF